MSRGDVILRLSRPKFNMQLIPEMNSPRSKYLVYTSAGDHANLHYWLKNSAGRKQSRNFDLWITYYGDEEGRYKDISNFHNMRKGSKFQNLYHVYQKWKDILDHYEAIFVLDDDIIIDCSGINQLFKIREQFDLWLLQPAFQPQGKISFDFTRKNPPTFMRYTNFVEVTCPLFRKDKLDTFMSVYDPVLTGWGIDLWYMDLLRPDSKKVAIVDAISCLNPHDSSKDGQREINKLERTAERRNKWLELKKQKNIKFDQTAIKVFGGLLLPDNAHGKMKRTTKGRGTLKVAVITPYFKTPLEWLYKCHLSIQAQTYPCVHFIVADGQPYDEVDSWDAQHIKLPVNISDYGDTPRGVGSIIAMSQGYDAIAYLDADNWYYPDHIATMVKLQRETGVAVVTSARNLHRLDGSLLGKCIEVDGENFVDTSCLFLTRTAFNNIPVWWSMPPKYHCIDDRVFWANIKSRNLSRIHSGKTTVAYRTAFANHYLFFGETPPEGSKAGMDIFEILKERCQKQQRGG